MFLNDRDKLTATMTKDHTNNYAYNAYKILKIIIIIVDITVYN